MQIDKINLNKDKSASVTFTQITKDNVEGAPEYFKITVKTNRHVQQRIYDIFSLLKPHATKLLELPKTFKDRISVTGASFTLTADKILGVTFACDRNLELHDTPVTESTPHYLVEKYDDNYKGSNILEKELTDLVYELMAEITKFVAGYQDQIELKLESLTATEPDKPSAPKE